MIKVILLEPMWFEGKLLPAGSELEFTKIDYEVNKDNFKHTIKDASKPGNK